MRLSQQRDQSCSCEWVSRSSEDDGMNLAGRQRRVGTCQTAVCWIRALGDDKRSGDGIVSLMLCTLPTG